jgi:hypothetical protein
MNKRVAALVAAMALVGGLLIMPSGGATAAGTPIPLDDATMISPTEWSRDRLSAEQQLATV